MAARRRTTLQFQLPFAAAVLFLTLATVLTLIAFQRTRDQSLDLASSRLIRLVDQLAGSVGTSVPTLLEAGRTAAGHPATISLLATGTGDTALVNDLLRPLVGGEAENSILALWDLAGNRVHTVIEAEGIDPWVGPPAPVDSGRLTAIQAIGDTLLFYEFVIPVRQGDRVIGHIQRRSRVAGNDGTRSLVAALLGDSGTLLFGSVDGLWTDLSQPVAAPPADLIGALDAAPYPREGAERLGVGRAVVGTPWLVVAELPRATVLGPSRDFLVQLATVAMVLVLATTVAAWVLGRRITAPLQSLADTARAIRGGDLTRRADSHGHRDVAAVAESFNQMADDNTRHIYSLRINEERLRSLMTATAQIVWLTRADGTIGDGLDSWRAFTGQKQAEVEGSGWLSAVHPDDRKRVGEEWQAAVREGREFESEYRARRHDGEFRWLQSRGVPVMNPDGSIREWIGAAADVTATHQIAAQLARKEQELIQAQRLDAIGRLAGGVAHDFNNILTAILVPAELALEQLPPDSPLRDDLREIHDAGKRATQLTGQLLAFGRQQVLHPTVVVFDDVIESAGRIVRRLIPESIDVVLNLHGRERRVLVDPTQLEQVLINLVVNARDAMPAGGQLTIETGPRELTADDVESHEGVSAGHYLMLAVTDTGIGMDAETREQIFDPFFTTKEKGRGTGLGLATVYGIVRQSGGHIWLYSEPGHGTVIKVFFPETHQAGMVAPAAPAATPTGTGTILFAEDEDALRRIGERMLRKLGYEVLVAPHGEAALEIAASHAGAIDLLVTDVVMPGMSGIDLAERIQERRPGLPVLFLSGWTGDDVIRHKMATGEVPFLQKPFTLDSLGRKVHEVMAGPSPSRGDDTPG